MGQLVKEKENSEFKPVKHLLKIDLVSYPARAEGLGKYDKPKLKKKKSFLYIHIKRDIFGKERGKIILMILYSLILYYTSHIS